MLYIFDLGNVVIDIDFNRVLGVWSNFSRVPLATLQKEFVMGEAFEQHERGDITDAQFAAKICVELGIALSFEQFTAGWQAVFVALRPEPSSLRGYFDPAARTEPSGGDPLQYQSFSLRLLAESVSRSASLCR